MWWPVRRSVMECSQNGHLTGLTIGSWNGTISLDIEFTLKW